ncbi:Putative hydrolase/MSMEI_3903 [Corynebacterium provencense]|uniref:Hydrolase/MSMEI_3903 n=1 Tax=Corynebacterium provencense TaxID=1737425 RepID=A0A2Z3YMA3_9CORY|nr:M20 family metallo-hydrolase [Corynebacterium provencense]AWT25076.1 Putative hydrolase/MSMEI_3903 [Corynebacterium provencense]
MTTAVQFAPSTRTADVTDEDFLADFHHTTVYGATEAGGIDRQAGTPEHGAVRAWFRERAAALGMTVTVDGIGNQYATFTWIDDEPGVLIGSHLDSQPLGGRFDGTYGVIAALHAAARVNDEVRAGRLTPTHNLTVVDWFNEEGARFAPSIMGSSVMVGLLDREKALATTDPAGVTVKEALESIDCLGTDPAPEVAAYAEIHIEQGRILEREQTTVGAVTQSWYTQKLLVAVRGEQSHTGATIMSDRHDALVAASRIVLFTEDVVENFEPEKIVTSVGQFTVHPNSPIVVPREVDLVIDLRASKKQDVLDARDILRRQIADLAVERGIRIDVEDYDIRDIQHYPVDGVELTEKAAADAGVSCMRIETMAGHDSVAVNRIAPSVMVFIPSVDGVSHCEREFSTDADMVAGVTAFTQIVRRLVTGALDGTTPGEPFAGSDV